MLVGKSLRIQQLNLIEQLEVGLSVVVVNNRKRIETVYEITDEILLGMIKKRLRREVMIHKNFIKIYVEKEHYTLNTVIKAIRLNTEQVI